MRQTNNSGRRPRGRPNRKPQGTNRNQNFDSSGPDGRIRGGANQIYEKYLTLARDAGSAGDRIAAEAFYQHAEHYFRIMNESTDPESPNGLGQRSQQGERDVNGPGPGEDRYRRPREGDGAIEAAQRQPAQSHSGTPSAAPAVAAGAAHSPLPSQAAPQPGGEIPGMEPQPAMPVEPPPARPAAQEAAAPQVTDKPRRGRPRKRPVPAGNPEAGSETGPEASPEASGVGARREDKADKSDGKDKKASADGAAEMAPVTTQGDDLTS